MPTAERTLLSALRARLLQSTPITPAHNNSTVLCIASNSHTRASHPGTPRTSHPPNQPPRIQQHGQNQQHTGHKDWHFLVQNPEKLQRYNDEEHRGKTRSMGTANRAIDLQELFGQVTKKAKLRKDILLFLRRSTTRMSIPTSRRTTFGTCHNTSADWGPTPLPELETLKKFALLAWFPSRSTEALPTRLRCYTFLLLRPNFLFHFLSAFFEAEAAAVPVARCLQLPEALIASSVVTHSQHPNPCFPALLPKVLHSRTWREALSRLFFLLFSPCPFFFTCTTLFIISLSCMPFGTRTHLIIFISSNRRFSRLNFVIQLSLFRTHNFLYNHRRMQRWRKWLNFVSTRLPRIRNQSPQSRYLISNSSKPQAHFLKHPPLLLQTVLMLADLLNMAHLLIFQALLCLHFFPKRLFPPLGLLSLRWREHLLILGEIFQR